MSVKQQTHNKRSKSPPLPKKQTPAPQPATEVKVGADSLQTVTDAPDPQNLRPEVVMALQRRYGNQYVQRLIQREPTEDAFGLSDLVAQMSPESPAVVQRDDDTDSDADLPPESDNGIIVEVSQTRDSIQRTIWLASGGSWTVYQQTEDDPTPPEVKPKDDGQIYDDENKRFFNDLTEYDTWAESNKGDNDEETDDIGPTSNDTTNDEDVQESNDDQQVEVLADLPDEDINDIKAAKGKIAHPHVVVIGGGPIGLLSALDAKANGAKTVTIIEKRLTYRRGNVPVLRDATINAMKRHGLDKELFEKRGFKLKSDFSGNLAHVPIKALEEEFSKKARGQGIRLVKGYTFSHVDESKDKKRKRTDPVFVRMTRDDAQFTKSKYSTAGLPEGFAMLADLVVFATGGGASRDPALQELGFEFDSVEVEEMGAYGTFKPKHGGGDINLDQYQHRKYLNKIARGGIQFAFETPEHNYILTFFSGLSHQDVQELQENPEELRELLTLIGKGKGSAFDELTENTGSANLFPVKLRRVKSPVSEDYPAVVIGDAAVTPHPSTGSGINEGVGSLEHLQKLVKKLNKGFFTSDSKHKRQKEQAFQAYGKNVSKFTLKKILSGMDVMIQAMLFTVRTLINDNEIAKGFNKRLREIMKVVSEAVKDIETAQPAYEDAKQNLEQLYTEIQDRVGNIASLREKMQNLRTLVNGANNEQQVQSTETNTN